MKTWNYRQTFNRRGQPCSFGIVIDSSRVHRPIAKVYPLEITATEATSRREDLVVLLKKQR